jgi:hypothetical protein
MPLVGRLPITGHPASIRRDRSPDAADPDEILPLFVPEPVAGNPSDVITLRLELRRNLVHVHRRLLGRNDARLRILRDLLGEGLVQRAAGEDFDVVVGVVVVGDVFFAGVFVGCRYGERLRRGHILGQAGHRGQQTSERDGYDGEASGARGQTGESSSHGGNSPLRARCVGRRRFSDEERFSSALGECTAPDNNDSKCRAGQVPAPTL